MGKTLENERTKPESARDDGAYENMSVFAELGTSFRTADKPGTQAAGPLARSRERTKPEYTGKQEAYGNISEMGRSSGWNLRGRRQPKVIRKLLAAVGMAFTWRKQRRTVRGRTNEAGM